MKIKSFSFIVFCLTFFLNYAYAQSSGIVISNAWVQAMPPSQTNTAAYMTITNSSSKEAVLASASCDNAGATEIHQMSDMNGMMNMAMASNLQIPANGSVTLKPGGFHIMLINLKKPLTQGDMIPITLHFQDGSVIVVNAQVKPQQEENPSGMQGMKM